jgi:hypothetical protein
MEEAQAPVEVMLDVVRGWREFFMQQGVEPRSLAASQPRHARARHVGNLVLRRYATGRRLPTDKLAAFAVYDVTITLQVVGNEEVTSSRGFHSVSHGAIPDLAFRPHPHQRRMA